ncbi:MAG: hypothetical protein ABL878_20300, partial [Burkholderiales bacterium]
MTLAQEASRIPRLMSLSDAVPSPRRTSHRHASEAGIQSVRSCEASELILRIGLQPGFQLSLERRRRC